MIKKIVNKIMRVLLIAIVLSLLPATSQASLIQYDLEFEAVLWSPGGLDDLDMPGYVHEGGAIRKTYNGTVIAYFDGQTTQDNSRDAFSLPLDFI